MSLRQSLSTHGKATAAAGDWSVRAENSPRRCIFASGSFAPNNGCAGGANRLGKTALISVVENLLSRAELDIEGRSAVMTAVRWYRAGTADFADYLIAALNREAGATPTSTFDERAASGSAFALVS